MGEIIDALVNDYEEQILDLQDRVNRLAADLVEVRARVREVERERDNATERLRLAKDALVATGYFTAEEVSDDVAPRIIEFASAKRVELEATQDDRDEYLTQAKAMAAQLKELHDFAEVWAAGSTISLAAAGRIVLKVLDGES